MTQKHSPIHPALRAHVVTEPWKRRRRIDFNTWPRLTVETERIPAMPSAPVRPSPGPEPLRLGGIPSRQGFAPMGEILLEKTEEEKRPLASCGP